MRSLFVVVVVDPCAECSYLGVCSPHPGPNNLEVTHTLEGLYLDSVVSFTIPIIAGCFSKAMSWMLWQKHLAYHSLYESETGEREPSETSSETAAAAAAAPPARGCTVHTQK